MSAENTLSLRIPRYRGLCVGNDHAGYPLKPIVLALLAPHCDRLVDVGAQSDAPVDFPDITERAAHAVLCGEAERAVLLCGTGVGACIAANKINGIRAAVATHAFVARQAVEHDDVNVLCLGAWVTGPSILAELLQAFLSAEFSHEKHFRRRVHKLSELERRTQDGKDNNG